MKNLKKSTLALSILIALLCVTGCGNPERWEHVNIHMINDNGESVRVFKDVKIICIKSDFLSGGKKWTRFEDKNGKQWTIMTPHNYEYL